MLARRSRALHELQSSVAGRAHKSMKYSIKVATYSDHERLGLYALLDVSTLSSSCLSHMYSDGVSEP